MVKLDQAIMYEYHLDHAGLIPGLLHVYFHWMQVLLHNV